MSATSRDRVLIKARDLERIMTAGHEVVLLDVRWTLAEPDGHRYYVAGHIPGARYVDLDADLADPASPRSGRHPLPSLEKLQQAARRWGIHDDDTVVVYDDSAGTAAARAWWLLRWAGMADVRILDGGLAAWNRIGAILEDGEVTVAPGTVTLTDGHMPVVDADGAAAAGRAGTLLDARAYERYTGEHEPIDPRAGHIPGARSAPTSENLDADGHFLPAEELGRRFRHLGVPEDDHAVVYCGSGVTAAHQVAAMSSLGLNAGLYPGSFSQWSADAHRPVATGPETHEQEAPGREAAGGEATGPEADRTGSARS